VGDLIDGGADEIVVGAVGGGLTIYRFDRFTGTVHLPEFEPAYEITLSEPLAPGDAVDVGDVLGGAPAEILVADASADRIRIYGYDWPSGRFEQVGQLDLTFEATDRLAVGYFGSTDKAQIVISHGAEATHRQPGTIEFFQYADGIAPGSARALDRLIDREGA
jgi:hypothetical protein